MDLARFKAIQQMMVSIDKLLASANTNKVSVIFDEQIQIQTLLDIESY